MRTALVVWGSSGHALVVADIIRELGQYEIVGFLDDLDPRPRRLTDHGADVLGGADRLAGLHQAGVRNIIVAIGDCTARLKLAETACSNGFNLVTAVHPRATVARGVCIGPGTVICAAGVVNPGARIGCSVIVNTAASVDHECLLEDGVHISPGAHLGGNVTVRRAAWVGIGASVKPHVTIGAGAILGAGAVLLSDLPAGTVAFGVPATVQRERQKNDA